MTQTTKTQKIKRGKEIADGKTKVVYEVDGDPAFAVIDSKDDITAGDGAKHDILEGKAKWSNVTTCNNFRFLKQCGVPVAFERQLSDTSFLAQKCIMLPYEVVVRREAHGSYLKRNLGVSKGHRFKNLVVEFFLKTNDKRWGDHVLLADDPLMKFSPGTDELVLYDPSTPEVEPFGRIPTAEVFGYRDEWKLFEPMKELARRVFLCLERAWQLNGAKLVDFKLEFGLNSLGQLVLSDVVDNDSWRVIEDDRYIDKQVYRDGGDSETIRSNYERVAEVTKRFNVPRQKIVLWRASTSDDIKPYEQALKAYSDGVVAMEVITISAHKSPMATARVLERVAAEDTGNTVIITCVGRSNGLGPTVAANTVIPVSTVPASWKSCHEDIWSSLRTPSNCPVSTILEPSNAIINACNILAMQNPALYADTRLRLEKQDNA